MGQDQYKFRTRTDVQCRYRDLEIQKAQRTAEKSASAEAGERTGELEGMESTVKAEQEREMDEKIGEGPIPIERFGIEFDSTSMSDIFWLFHP
jgi:hypothetical protein